MTHSSKNVNDLQKLQNVADWYEKKYQKNSKLSCSTKHVDGRDNALARKERLGWLEKSDNDENECRVLSNARCLTEGVDVPSLDAVIFLNPKSSVIDIIQAVGRAIRKSDSKKYGYIILPIVIPDTVDTSDALYGDKVYGSLFKVLNALRAHDDRISQKLLNGDGNIETVLYHPEGHIGKQSIGKQDHKSHDKIVQSLKDMPRDIIQFKIVENLSDRQYLERWAEDVEKIVNRIKLRIDEIKKRHSKVSAELVIFHNGLKKIINNSITYDMAIDMLSQHMIMAQIFDILFDSKFTTHNAVAKSMNNVLNSISAYGLKSELKDLDDFYTDIKNRVSRVTSDDGRQRIIQQLYDQFFNHAFKKTAKKLGIVYTPIEAVDFIMRSVDDVLYENFGKHLTNKNIDILDPFTGTGSFITRLLSSDLNLVKSRDLKNKYQHEIHANEIVLLAYYTAVVNCESTFMERSKKYLPFKGIVMTDTFAKTNLNEWNPHFKETTKKIKRQRDSDIKVIVGNPPYSISQKNFMDDNANVKYPHWDNRIAETYAKKTSAGLKHGLYDSYVRAIRWASDRIEDYGVIGFVTNSSFLRGNAAEGIRACLYEEFTDVYCFDLRGDAHTKGDARAKEGGNIFGSGSRAPIVITILVKNPDKKGCKIHYLDIGDYLPRKEKLEKITKLESINRIKKWQSIVPDKHHDWLDQRDDSYELYMPIHDDNLLQIFTKISPGLLTGRDLWSYNSSKSVLSKNMLRHVTYCNAQNLDELNIGSIDSKCARWSPDLTKRLRNNKPKFNDDNIITALYRPFFKQYIYFDKTYIERIQNFFPDNNDNLIICIPYKPGYVKFSTFITNVTPDLQVLKNGRCLSMYTYVKKEGKLDEYIKNDNITNVALEEYRAHYKKQHIDKDDIFYYIYGMLHHPGYIAKYQNNLSKELPRIPMASDFVKFNEIGRKLAVLHLKFDSSFRHTIKASRKIDKFEKLGFVSIKTSDGKSRKDKTQITVDGNPVFSEVPICDYQVNGRTPVEWIVDRYKRTVDDTTGIVNDATKDVDIKAVLERAVHIGLETDRLVSQLPKNYASEWTPMERNLDAHFQK